jgi:hypothetical protein
MFGIETHHFYTSHLDGMGKIVKCGNSALRFYWGNVIKVPVILEK